MTLQETRDQFIAEYHFECTKRVVPVIELNNKIIAAWIAEGQSEITDTLNITRTYTDITLIGDGTYHEYDLPTNYGCALSAKYNGAEVDLVSLIDLDTTSSTSVATPSRAAIYHTGVKWVMAIEALDSSVTAYTLRLWYNINTGHYAASGTSAQNWGTFDGTTFTGSLKIPDKYYRLLLDYLLSKMFDDYKMIFENKLKKAKNSFSHSVNTTLPYNFAGIKN